jgi:hypothetical protein
MWKPFAVTTLIVLINYLIHAFSAGGSYLFDFNPPKIIFDINKLYSILNEILLVLSVITFIYLMLRTVNTYVDHFIIRFKNSHRNLKSTKSYYHFSIQLFKSIYHMHDSSIAMLMFIGMVQYIILDKKINLINYIVLVIYSLIISTVQWFADWSIHSQNRQFSVVFRKTQIHRVRNSSIKIGDILIKHRNDTIPVPEGIVHDVNIVTLSLAQVGERVLEQHNIGKIVQENLVIKNQEGVKIRVTKLFSETQMMEDNMDISKHITVQSTNFGICTILLFAVIIYHSKRSEFLDIVELILDVIRCFIGLNYLIPSFKVRQSLNLWDSMYRYICENKYHMKVSNHGDPKVQFTPEDTYILSDKTGTLTDDKLSIDQILIQENAETDMDLLIAHMNGILDDDGKHTSHSPETNEILNYLKQNMDITLNNHFNWIDQKQKITYLRWGETKDFFRIEKKLYHPSLFGSISFIEDRLTRKFKMGILGNKSVLEKRFNCTGLLVSKKRGMMFICIELDTVDQYKETIQKLEDTNVKIDNFRIVGEFHFDNLYRNNQTQDTGESVIELKTAGFAIGMITGDSLITAHNTALELGIIKEDGLVIDGAEFVEMSEDRQRELVERAYEEKGVVFGNTRALFKEKIVIRFQERGQVWYQGDMENDYYAAKRANGSNIQSNGNKKCKNIANMESDVTMAGTAKYLLEARDLGIRERDWFLKELQRFNYLTAGIWYFGLMSLDYEKNNLIFLDPWSASMSLLMSTYITILCMYRSFTVRHQEVSDREIIYYTPIKSICLGTLVGLLLYLSPLVYTSYSIIAITTMMIF